MESMLTLIGGVASLFLAVLIVGACVVWVYRMPRTSTTSPAGTGTPPAAATTARSKWEKLQPWAIGVIGLIGIICLALWLYSAGYLQDRGLSAPEFFRDVGIAAVIALLIGWFVTSKAWKKPRIYVLGLLLLAVVIGYFERDNRPSWLISTPSPCTRLMQDIEMDSTPKPIPGNECQLLHIATGGDITLTGPGGAKLVDYDGKTPPKTKLFLTSAIGPRGSVLHFKACHTSDTPKVWDCNG